MGKSKFLTGCGGCGSALGNASEVTPEKILQHVVTGGEYRKDYDINGDGKVNSFDASLLKRKVDAGEWPTGSGNETTEPTETAKDAESEASTYINAEIPLWAKITGGVAGFFLIRKLIQ